MIDLKINKFIKSTKEKNTLSNNKKQNGSETSFAVDDESQG